MINYLIDNIELESYGVKVSETKGLFDIPKMKKPLSVNWPDRHGEQVDLTTVRFEPREITLICYMVAASRLEFLTRINEFAKTLLMSPGLKQLVVAYDAAKPLVYMVYLPGGMDVKRVTKWNALRQTGTFQIRLREPESVKRILKFEASVGSMQADISFVSSKQVTVYWGDKSETPTNTGTPVLSHVYAAPGVYYITLTGVIEEITDFTTNANIIWQYI